MNNGSWTEIEKQYVRDHYTHMTPDEIGEYLCKSVVAVKQWMLRHDIAIQRVDRNLVRELLVHKFVDAEYFRPTRKFYDATGITQQRWGDLRLGRKQITEDEYRSLCRHLNITMDDGFETRQLALFTAQHNDK